MVKEELPHLVALPLQTAIDKLGRERYKVKVVKTLPPGYHEADDSLYRVVRQQLLHNKLVELVVTIDLGKRG